MVEECGRGVSATVWKAICKTYNEEVAVKLMDLENMNCSLDEIVREAQTMRQLHHPHMLPLYCSFVAEDSLWMVMPFVNGGSILNIMRYGYKEGLDEPSIATIMKPVLQALEYLHRHNIVHRDVKAGNILIENNGNVLLGDFGVAATLERGGSWGNKLQSRNTFVGTPCWMAPEVMEQSGYDAKADIWSFGITLLELAHGHAPFARLPPMKVLLMTIQNPPPTLEDSNGNKHFSKHMRELVTRCLQKDPAQRPTAAQLLEHRFFKTAHDHVYLAKHLLAGLPPISVRMAELTAGQGEAKKEDKEILASQQEYRRGVSSWNLDVSAIKAAAAEIPPTVAEDQELNVSQLDKSPLKGIVGASPLPVGTPKGGKHPKEQGRFKVYEGDEVPPFATPPTGLDGGQLLEDHMRGLKMTPGGGVVDENDLENLEKAKRKGRFRYVEESAGEEGKPRLPKAASTASAMDSRAGSAVTSPTGAPAHMILPNLKELLESMQLQQDFMRELVGAVGDTERGRMGALNSLLQQGPKLRPPREETERLKSEIATLKEENARLKERLRSVSAD